MNMTIGYNEAAWIFLEEYLTPFAPVIPNFRHAPASPWKDFCGLNPGMKDLSHLFSKEQDYELSERQASWACMAYRWQINTNRSARI